MKVIFNQRFFTFHFIFSIFEHQSCSTKLLTLHITQHIWTFTGHHIYIYYYGCEFYPFLLVVCLPLHDLHDLI